MVKIGVHEATPFSAGSYYRTVGTLQKLKIQFPDLRLDFFKMSSMPDMGEVMKCDIVLMLRPTEQSQRELLFKCGEYGVPIWCDFDDDVLDIPAVNPANTFYKNEGRRAVVMDCLRFANQITTSTRYLATKYEKMVGRADFLVVPNAVEEVETQKKYFTGKPFEIYWRGSPTHGGDLEMWRELFVIIAKDNRYRLNIIGHFPAFLSPYADKIRALGFLDLHTYFRTLREIQPDFLLFPLETNDFNLAKSNIAWLEATQAGAATVTNFDGAEWVFDGIGKTFNEKWADADLLDKKKELHIKAVENVNQNFNIKTANQIRFHLINDLLEKRGEKNNRYRLLPPKDTK